MRAKQIFQVTVNLFYLAMFLLPVVAMIHYAERSYRADREFRAQQEEYYRVMTKKIKEYNEMKERARK